ncbi:unnamed protein product [Adineta steineri]|uniref:Uncharacterized protein n=1 Tax=Adineta steineri TaxID=433720 RepID=A0A815P662_9BILA|nr:unnamed protein product [Adineta steineri]CAF1169787.1 unnamed protein product [Adineta steineri]CAF1261346.1 unnamed protein product [Adineta steineri]CAF1313213.1 unnamed protein product [Adineta steineri]CAF1444811.1 unnamed protein product [Adineta steineri]
MALSEDFSRESRQYYARSSSFGNLHELSSSYNSSNLHRTASSTIISRDCFAPSIAWDCFDNQVCFQRQSRVINDFDHRIQWRVCNDMMNREVINHNTLSFERCAPVCAPICAPVCYREYNTVSTRIAPNECAPLTTIERREKVYRKLDDHSDWSTNSFRHTNEYHSRGTGPFGTDSYSKQDIQYSDSSHRQRKLSIPEFSSSSTRINFC